MPEYLAPGVYVEEYEANAQPIPGVSTSIDGATARSLIDRFKDLAPHDWTGFNESDPGITLVELFAWLAEVLLYRTGGATDARREAALRELLPAGQSMQSSRHLRRGRRRAIEESRLMTRVDPLRNFRFRVEIDGIAAAAFTEIVIGPMTVQAIDYREGTDPPHVRKRRTTAERS